MRLLLRQPRGGLPEAGLRVLRTGGAAFRTIEEAFDFPGKKLPDEKVILAS